MFSKLTFITSARCANSSTECGEKQTGVSHLTTQAIRDVMQSCIRELSLTPRQIESHQSFCWCGQTQPEFRSSLTN